MSKLASKITVVCIVVVDRVETAIPEELLVTPIILIHKLLSALFLILLTLLPHKKPFKYATRCDPLFRASTCWMPFRPSLSPYAQRQCIEAPRLRAFKKSCGGLSFPIKCGDDRCSINYLKSKTYQKTFRYRTGIIPSPAVESGKTGEFHS